MTSLLLIIVMARKRLKFILDDNKQKEEWMICSLHIEHYALIDELDIEFRPGFSVITGETGAGKSIILGAAQMLLGERADFGVVRHGEKKAVVEAELDVTGMDLDRWMDDAGLDFDGTTVTLRRELTAAGIDPSRRGETLTIEEYAALADHFAALKEN